MAEGGEAKPFCSTSRPHDKGCQYFANGDIVSPDFIPDSGMTSDDAPDFIPDDTPAPIFAPSKSTGSEAPDFIPDEDVGNDNADLSPAELQAKMVEAAHPEGTGGFQGPGQQLANAAEGVAQGVAGPLATLAETKLLGIDPEDIKARQEANPGGHHLAETAGLVGSMLTGVGEAALAEKVGVKIAEALPGFGKIGGKVIQNALSCGAIQAGDEASKWMLGQGDPADAVGASLAHTGASALVCGILGGASDPLIGSSKNMLRKASESQIGERAKYFLYGLGNAAKGENALSGIADKLPAAASKGFKAGEKFFGNITGKFLTTSAGAAAGAARGWHDEGMLGAVKGGVQGAAEGYLGGLAAKVGAKGVSKVMPAFLKVLSNGHVEGLMDAFDHAANMAAGSKAIDKTIDHVFRTIPLAGQQSVNLYGDEKARQKLDDWLEGGGIGQELKDQIGEQNTVPGFADGGAVQAEKKNGVELHYPEQNIMLNAARARISGYLNSQRPSKVHPKLAFDDEPDTRDQEKKYKKALDIAAQPLGILHEVKNGTIEPEHMQHFTAMHPELYGLLQKRLVNKVSQSQMDGEKPSFKVRQGLSLFLGAPLSSEFTPAAIQAAQQTFVSVAAQKHQDQAPKPKTNTSTLSKSDASFLTGSQAREKREQRA